MKLMFVGDISLGDYYLSFGHGPRSYSENDYVFSQVQSLFDSADILVGNLEAAITTHGEVADDPESMVLRARPAAVNQLTKAGFDFLQIANNHTVQHGDEGFDETLSLLAAANIQPVGLEPQKIVTVSHAGAEIGFLAASDVPDNTDKSQSRYQRLDDQFLELVEREVKNVDHLIVMLHWGLEASTSPLPYQRTLAERLRTAGVRAIIGTHPHLFYEVEKHDNHVTAYSLGNFVFDLCWDKRMMQSGILEINIQTDSVDARLWPVTLSKNGALPTPKGSAVSVQDVSRLYQLGTEMDFQALRKIYYMLSHIHLGDTALKFRFVKHKLVEKLKPIILGN